MPSDEGALRGPSFSLREREKYLKVPVLMLQKETVFRFPFFYTEWHVRKIVGMNAVGDMNVRGEYGPFANRRDAEEARRCFQRAYRQLAEEEEKSNGKPCQ